MDKIYEEYDDIIKLFRCILPCDRMYISNKGYIIPIDDRYLRDRPESFGFKYGGQVTCLGYVTNIIGADTYIEDGNNIFATVQHVISELIRKILPLKDDNLFIITPIAIYYANNEIKSNVDTSKDRPVK